MPLDLRGFMDEPNQWTGLYRAADQMEKRKQREDQLAMQKEAKRNATATFLQNYLDPKDLLSGTAYDPMLLQGLQTAMQQGSKLAASGADAPMLMMALGPMVNKLTTYSANAKNINKQVDDQIQKIKESGVIGYDYAKLKDQALKMAFYKTDPNTGESSLNPDQADPTVNWAAKAIQDYPELITTTKGWDTFADKAKMKTNFRSVTDYDRFGTKDAQKVNLIYQEYMEPEWEGNKVKGFVPKYERALTGNQALMHDFVKPDGSVSREQVRVLDENIFDGLPTELLDNIRGQVKQHLKEYKTATGEDISMNSPKAKLVGRALAYKELNREQRNFGTIQHTGINNQLSGAQIRVNVGSTPEALALKEAEAAAKRRGITSVTGSTGKANAVEIVLRAFGNDSEVLQGEPIDKDGVKVYDITPMFPGGGINAGRGADFKYKGIYFDPGSRQLIVDKETTDRFGMKHKNSEIIPEKDIDVFLHKIAQPNGVGLDNVKNIKQKLGFSAAFDPAADFNDRVPSWRDAWKSVNDKFTNPFGSQKQKIQ